MHGEWSTSLALYGGGCESSTVSSGRMRTCRGEEGGLDESETTMTVEPWREGQQGRSCRASGEIGKEDERRGMRETLMRTKSDLEQGSEEEMRAKRIRKAVNGLARSAASSAAKGENKAASFRKEPVDSLSWLVGRPFHLARVVIHASSFMASTTSLDAPTDPLLGSDVQQLRDESRPGDRLALYIALVCFSQLLVPTSDP
jgi:hypothetical protein